MYKDKLFFTLSIQHKVAGIAVVPGDEWGTALDRWQRGKSSKGMDISAVEILIMAVIMLTRMLTQAETDLCPFYVFQLYLLKMFNRKLGTGESNNLKNEALIS